MGKVFGHLAMLVIAATVMAACAGEAPTAPETTTSVSSATINRGTDPATIASPSGDQTEKPEIDGHGTAPFLHLKSVRSVGTN